MLHAMRTHFCHVIWNECRCFLVRRWGQALGPLKVVKDNSKLLEAWSYLPLVRRSLSPTTDPDKLADLRRWSLGSLENSFQFSGLRRKAGAWRCWSCWVKLKDDFTHLNPVGWSLSAKLLLSVLFRKENIPQPGMEWVEGLKLPQQARALVCLSGFVAASPNSCVSHLVAGLDSTACKMKIPIEETKEWDLSLAQARLAMECWSWPAGILKAGPWNHVMPNCRN